NLPSNSGVNVNLWDYKQRKNLVIVFHHERACNYCRKKLRELAKAYKEIQFLEAEVLAVSFDHIENLKDQRKEDAFPFPLLRSKWSNI
ncbi:MAG: redoxin domain-containing protein, partial [Candidatus Bathyarchaeia archaeon]